MSVEFVSSSILPTEWGTFTIYVFLEADGLKEHIALVMGDMQLDASILCRVHSECLTGDAFFSLRCDCGSQLKEAMKRIAERGKGVILYLRQEGRDIGLGNKIKAYKLQDEGADTVQANEKLGFSADERSYEVCKDIFSYLNIQSVELMTNNPLKVSALQEMGIEVTGRQSIITGENSHNASYLATKRNKLGHISS